jgi:hypothetical protein
MNIWEYKNAMNQIVVDTANIQASFENKRKKEKSNGIKNIVPSFAILAILLVVFIAVQGIPATEPNIIMTVYAAENSKVQLTKEFVTIKTTADLFLGSSTLDSKGNHLDSKVNYNINFLCEGQNIRVITYSCSDKKITRADISSATAYYVENITMPLEEYRRYKANEDEQFLVGFYGESQSDAHVTRLIGEAYTVSYENQATKPYGLVVAAEVDANENYHFNDFTIHVKIELKDGSIIKKKLLVHSGDNAFNEIEIRIM